MRAFKGRNGDTLGSKTKPFSDSSNYPSLV